MKIKQHFTPLLLSGILFLSTVIIIIAVFRKQVVPEEPYIPTLENKEEQVYSEYVVVYGDSRTGHDIHKKIVEEITEINPVAVFNTGDLVNNGTKQSDWDMFFSITRNLLKQTKFYPALGNHERNSDIYFDSFELPGNERWYDVDIIGVHFIVLDSDSDIDKNSKQYVWLKKELEKNSTHENLTAVVFHHPPYSVGTHGESLELQKTIVPLFDKYDVDIVFNGHEHNYQRNFINSIYYIVTGGGGAPLYDQAVEKPYNQVFLKSYNFCTLQMVDDTLQMKVYNDDSELIDSVEVKNV